jgi:hypothetical protein
MKQINASRPSGISEPVVRFIEVYINSVELLEILLLLRKYRNRSWTAAEVSSELRTDIHSAEMKLNELYSNRLLSSNEETNGQSYQYNPTPSSLDPVVKGLEEAYRERRFTVIDLIFSKPIDSIQTFSDAFRFKKDN